MVIAGIYYALAISEDVITKKTMAKTLLFVTKGNDDYEEGFSYAADLARILKKGIIVLIIYDKSLLKSFDDKMTAAAFAEAGETGTAKEIPVEWLRETEGLARMKTDLLIEKYCKNEEPLHIMCKAGIGNIVSNIKKVVQNTPSIEMVLLSPSLSDKRVSNAIKLLRNISVPVVTMSKRSNVHK